MSDIIIRIEELSKHYQLGQVGTGTLTHDLKRWYSRIRGKEDPTLKIGQENVLSTKTNAFSGGGSYNTGYVWALKNINLEVRRGDVLGIIGKNGAGKSTLLKILSQVTLPTKGCIKVKGRIASLLEVGTGFHSELTGRENIFLNGAILGMTNAEIKRKFDEIVQFSGVERYIDTPVKRYSSGMYVRLAFAVAAHLEPEILVIDEVLAVGDAEFQKKALGKMQEISTREGRTVLFVSHNMGTIRRLCNKGILLVNGTKEYYGSAISAVKNYEEKLTQHKQASWINAERSKFLAKLDRIEIKNRQGILENQFYTSEEIIIHIHFRCFDILKNVKIGFDLIKNGDVVFRTQQVDYLSISTFEKDHNYGFSCKIPSWFLNSGDYYIRPLFSLHCAESLTSVYDNVAHFRIVINPEKSDFHTLLTEENHPGAIFPILEWNLNYSSKILKT